MKISQNLREIFREISAIYVNFFPSYTHPSQGEKNR